MSSILHARFTDFISPGIDRYELLRSILNSEGLNPSTITLGGNRHLMVGPMGRKRSRAEHRLTILIAHYDRAEGSPGANDNGAAVFELLEATKRLCAQELQGWLAVFTDKEESAGQTGIHSQGAYSLAMGFKDLGYGASRFYIFDVCGRGDTLVLSTAVDQLLRGTPGMGAEHTLHSVRSLRTQILKAARKLFIQKILLLPTPFSDDVGFLAAGLSAQTLTVLPEEEALRIATTLRRRPALAACLVNREAEKEKPLELPATWQDMNSQRDGEDTLTPEIFPKITDLAYTLCAKDF